MPLRQPIITARPLHPKLPCPEAYSIAHDDHHDDDDDDDAAAVVAVIAVDAVICCGDSSRCCRSSEVACSRLAICGTDATAISLTSVLSVVA